MSNLDDEGELPVQIRGSKHDSAISANICVLGAGLFSIAGGLVAIAAALAPRGDTATFGIGAVVLFGVAGILLLFALLRSL